MKKLCAVIFVVTLAAGGLITTSASAADQPGNVQLVQVVRNGTGSLHLNWSSAPGASSYQVEMATDFEMTDRHRVASPGPSALTVDGLANGQTYCFQVRAMNGNTAGNRSPRTCKTTIIRQGAEQGAIYRLLTYNLCTRACANWGGRRGQAVELIQNRNPDVVALQETQKDSGMDTVLTGYKLAHYKSAKMLLYRASRFTEKRSGEITLGPKRYAVWADLADRNNGGRRVIFTSVHASPGNTQAADRSREQEVENLVEGIRRINGDNSPVIFGGDFNSHKHRDYDSPARVLQGAGYHDSYDLAQRLRRPNFNSANGFEPTPRIGATWGDHVDHFWVDPDQTRVLKWANAASVVNGVYSPLPSNHNPIFARIIVN
jgi:endonuclease/exonuclease/phosphatase family metal-dependent hydrolase